MNDKNIETRELEVLDGQPERAAWQTPRLKVVLARNAAVGPSSNLDGDTAS
jgi:hypothetical protein